MGTYLYAHVEYEYNGVWHSLCDWDFGKAYNLMHAIDDVAGVASGWPEDTSLQRDEEKCDVYAKRMCTYVQLDGVKRTELYEWEHTFLRALLACCKNLEDSGFRVRILWGRD